jgi:anti-sigma regulatory factor (Ser/Thr protein kinase)
VGDVRELRSAASARRQDARAHTVELVLAPERAAPRAARHWIMRSIAEAGVHGVSNQVIELLAGEVVANAVLHGPPDGEIKVEVRVDGEAVKVSVTDQSPDRPRVLHPAPTAASGRGMALVAALSTAWGIERREPGGKTVWFTVDPEAER